MPENWYLRFFVKGEWHHVELKGDNLSIEALIDVLIAQDTLKIWAALPMENGNVSGIVITSRNGKKDE